MKYRLFILSFSFLITASISAFSQQAEWPKSFNTDAGLAKMYEPQPESYQGNLLKVRAAVSLLRNGKSDPVFGVLWADITVDNSQDREVAWKNATVTNIKFPGETDDAELNELTAVLEKDLPSWNIQIAKDDLTAKLENSEKESKLSENLKTTPPKIIYSKTPSILVLIDGLPQLSNNPDWSVEQVTNTPFTIIKNTDQQFYLYGAKRWYTASTIKGPWKVINQVPSQLEKIDEAVRASDTSKVTATSNAIPEIIVSTEPAELIQSEGEANFTPIQGTNLLYMSNTSNDIFLDVNTQQYYVLISGRWYKAPNLSSSWTYTSSDNLPADFAKIPEGSPKDVVLPNIAGTNAANESVMEAQVPQTAKVDRKTAKATVTYDGNPEFEQIEGTNLKYAINTPGTVLNLGRKYYYIENGVWFESNNAMGPWAVATSRPAEVENIPPSYPVYNAKYVYIYDATPDYVYMGYTPGYLGNYIYGPTIVYGTGYYYKPWRGHYYYPRAMTWGFNMRYNPWTGWNFGLDFWGGWFSFGIGNYYHGPLWGGWWGPQVYRPAYCRPYNYNYGYYGGRGRNVVINNNYRIINNNRSNNIYRYRRDVVTHDRPGFNYSRNNNINGRSSTPFNGNNGRFNNNNARVIPGNNPGQGNNRFQGQRTPNSQNDSRQVDRRYQPDNRFDRGTDRSRISGNNPQQRSAVGSPDIRQGNPQQHDAGSRIISPDRSARSPQGRSDNSISDNPSPREVRPVERNRSVNPATESPRIQQERSVRVAQDRSFSTPAPVQQENNFRVQRERPAGIQNRQSAPINSSPSPRIERPSRDGGNRGNIGGGRPEGGGRSEGGGHRSNRDR